ncbi:MAG: hypothetical protein ACTS73_02105 [Arsenophonus sp. NEOnobi-MAG3]
MTKETSERYLVVGIDRTTQWVFIHLYKAKIEPNAQHFLRDLNLACLPWLSNLILIDNGKEFTDRLFNLQKHLPAGE